MNVLRVGTFIRDQRLTAKLSLRKAAALAGVSIPYLSQIERGLRKPSADILQAIAKGLRISAETLYVQAGILDEKTASDVATAVMADLFITESQKRALLQIYRAFRDETGRAAPDEAIAEAAAELDRPSARGTRKSPKTASRRRAATRGGGRKAGGRTGSQAGSSPHPAPTRSPAPT